MGALRWLVGPLREARRGTAWLVPPEGRQGPLVGVGEWLEANEACALLRCRIVRLVRLVDDGLIAADGVDGRMLFSRADVERIAAQRPRDWVPAPRRKRAPPPEPEVVVVPESDAGPSLEVLQQAQLLGKFLDAAEAGRPGPCPVCGEMMPSSGWPAHLLEHR